MLFASGMFQHTLFTVLEVLAYREERSGVYEILKFI